ncbi:MAG: ATP-binding protein [Parachlamydiaceae bacterium]
MLEEILTRNEGKTLEFKENSQSLQKIIQTVIAFANTAGGIILLGVKDETKEIVGLKNILQHEEKIANAIADSVSPLLVPNLQFCSFRERDILIITVPYSPNLYHLKSKGELEGTFIRLGSTNRLADAHTIAEMRRLKEHSSFDRLPDYKHSVADFDFELAKRLFAIVGKTFTEAKAKSLELIIDHQSELYPTKGGLLLFGKDRDKLFPDPIARMIRFEGISKHSAFDELETRSPLPQALEEILVFIRRHTSVHSSIRGIRREEIPQYPSIILREAVMNALVHADYANQRSPIQIAIFDDRLEITNPGALPFGLSLDTAISGVSQLRNKILGRIFRELKLTEHWGSGLKRMLEICEEQNISLPKFEELDNFFRVTLYPRSAKSQPSASWQKPIFDYLQEHSKINAKIAQEIWQVTRRTTTTRLKEMCNSGLLVDISTSPKDPKKEFVLSKHRK